MERSTNTHKIRGFTAVEAVVAVSIAALVLIYSTHSLVRFLNTGKEIADKTEALYLAEEALEMVRFIRDEKWSHIVKLTDGDTYYLSVTGADIATSTSPETIGIFTRSFEVNPVERNGADDIVSSGTEDPGSKYVTATVTWGNPIHEISLSTIIADINNP